MEVEGDVTDCVSSETYSDTYLTTGISVFYEETVGLQES